MTRRLRIAIPLFPRFTALDAIGPYEVLAQVPAFGITFVGHARARCATATACSAWLSTAGSRTCRAPT